MISWREFLIGVIVALAFYATELAVFMRKPKKSSGGGQDNLLLDTLLDDIAQLRQKQEEIQKELEKLKEETLAPAPYSHAIKMVRQGIGPAEIAASCNISKGEAELIASLHKARS